MPESYQLFHSSYGQAAEVLKARSVTLKAPAADELQVSMLAAAIHPSDLGMLAGSYGQLRSLPAVAGREGVGVIEALGSEVDGWQVGQRVRIPDTIGCWQSRLAFPATNAERIPEGIRSEQAALAFINPPTAYCLLKKILPLKVGDWVLQNASNSAVGIAVIQLAKAFGFKTLNTVRRPELIAPLKALGADQVVLEGSGWHQTAADYTQGAPIRLALNSVGGSSAIDQIKALAEGGTQVTFGAMTGEAVRFPTRYLIFKHIQLQGFWWDQWRRDQGSAAVDSVMQAIFQCIQSGQLKTPIAQTYALVEYQAALAHAQAPRMGKVLFSAQ